MEEMYKPDSTIKIAQKHLNEGDFQKAIETYNVAYNKYPNASALRSNYIKTIEHIKKNADIAFSREDFALAGFIYHVLLKNCAQFNDFASLLSFDKDFLSNRIKACSKILSERGLVEYREGNLEKAISIWKNILRFDPENTDVKKSIDTTTIQLKTLQKKN
jgi:tetratricopeptide (TPR) repeat protein